MRAANAAHLGHVCEPERLVDIFFRYDFAKAQPSESLTRHRTQGTEYRMRGVSMARATPPYLSQAEDAEKLAGCHVGLIGRIAVLHPQLHML